MTARYKEALEQDNNEAQDNIFNRDPKELQQDLMDEYEQAVHFDKSSTK